MAKGCSSTFAKLRLDCGAFARSLTAQSTSKVRPFGQDPAFNPSSRLFSAGALGAEGRYYNTSAGSDDLTAVGYPAAFFPRAVPGLPPGFPVFFPVLPQSLRIQHILPLYA